MNQLGMGSVAMAKERPHSGGPQGRRLPLARRTASISSPAIFVLSVCVTCRFALGRVESYLSILPNIFVSSLLLCVPCAAYTLGLTESTCLPSPAMPLLSACVSRAVFLLGRSHFLSHLHFLSLHLCFLSCLRVCRVHSLSFRTRRVNVSLAFPLLDSCPLWCRAIPRPSRTQPSRALEHVRDTTPLSLPYQFCIHKVPLPVNSAWTHGGVHALRQA